MNNNNDNIKNSGSEKEEITEKLHRLMRLMHRRNHRVGGEIFADGIQRGQGRILAMLQVKPEMTQKELSYLLNIRNQSLGEMLAKLEKKGYIVRAASDEDKRMMKVSLTDKGVDAAKRLQNKSYGILKIFETLSADEMRIFSAILDKLIAEFEAEAQNDEDLEPEAVTAFKKVGKFFKTPFAKVFTFDNDTDGEIDIDIDSDEDDDEDGDNGGRKIIKIKKKIIKDDGKDARVKRKIIINGVEVDPEAFDDDAVDDTEQDI